jgi:hypothetical protein
VSEEEAEMWADYRENGADFSAGDNVGDPEARFEQLREEAKCFGLWNPDATARRLGFGDAPEVPEDVEDDYLGEIMRDAGELECLWSLEVVETGNGRKVVRYDHMIMAFDKLATRFLSALPSRRRCIAHSSPLLDMLNDFLPQVYSIRNLKFSEMRQLHPMVLPGTLSGIRIQIKWHARLIAV